MQKDTRYILETVALITQIANAHYKPAIEAEPQRQSVELDRRIVARLVTIAQSVAAGFNNKERYDLEMMTTRLAAHYGDTEHTGPVEELTIDPGELDIPESAIYSRDEPEKLRAIPKWGIWTKIGKTLAVRIDGPFACITKEGPLTCNDGYLVLDAQGYPYPVSREIFETTYANELNEQIAGRCVLPDEGAETAVKP
jgi:hypothetical protein